MFPLTASPAPWNAFHAPLNVIGGCKNQARRRGEEDVLDGTSDFATSSVDIRLLVLRLDISGDLVVGQSRPRGGCGRRGVSRWWERRRHYEVMAWREEGGEVG